MSVGTLIAKRYAHAFLNLYINNLTDADFIEVQHAIVFFSQNRPLLALLKVPHIQSEEKIAALEQVLIANYKLPEVFKKLIALLVHNKRASLILETLEQLKKLYRAHQNIEFYKISSSHVLNGTELKTLQKFLAQKTGRTIFYTYTIDPSLIAGIRMQSNERLWEYSIKKQLASLSHQ
jgi:F-type H+-transporting ATPase subunit delta